MTDELKALVEKINRLSTGIPEVMNYQKAAAIQHGQWQFPVISRDDLVHHTQQLAQLIRDHSDGFDVELNSAELNEISERLNFLIQYVMPNLAGQSAAIQNYYLGIQQIREILISILPPLQVNSLSRQVSMQKARVRSIESRLNQIEPRTEGLDQKIKRIEEAHDAADQLPTTLEDLIEAREKITQLLADSQSSSTNASNAATAASNLQSTIEITAEDARKILQKCEDALRSSTSVGLAAAFYERSSELKSSVWIWLTALVASLVGVIYLGSQELGRLATLIEPPNAPTSIIIVNILSSMVSISACIWLAWLSTKQIGHRFRLAEDYAFKASISRAYEGYRSEAARIDETLEAQLLTSALNRLDELPLRLVETFAHGSPWSELLNSETVKTAIKTVPSFVEAVKDLAATQLSRHRLPNANKNLEENSDAKQSEKQGDGA